MKYPEITVLGNDILVYLNKLEKEFKEGVDFALIARPFSLMNDYGKMIEGRVASLMKEINKVIAKKDGNIANCIKDLNIIAENYETFMEWATITRDNLSSIWNGILVELEDARRVHADANGMIVKIAEMNKEERKNHNISRKLAGFLRQERRYLGAEEGEAKKIEGHLDEMAGLIQLMLAFIHDIIKYTSHANGEPLITKAAVKETQAEIVAMELESKMNLGSLEIRTNAKIALKNLLLTFVASTKKIYDNRIKRDLNICDVDSQRTRDLAEEIAKEIKHFKYEHFAELKFLQKKVLKAA